MVFKMVEGLHVYSLSLHGYCDAQLKCTVTRPLLVYIHFFNLILMIKFECYTCLIQYTYKLGGCDSVQPCVLYLTAMAYIHSTTE